MEAWVLGLVFDWLNNKSSGAWGGSRIKKCYTATSGYFPTSSAYGNETKGFKNLHSILLFAGN